MLANLYRDITLFTLKSMINGMHDMRDTLINILSILLYVWI